MTISTDVVWADGTPTESQNTEIFAQATAMTNAGKTDGTYNVQQGVPISSQRTTTRTWTTTADAEEWVAFILTYNPVSAEIIP
jgi:hypothetical protein